MRTYFIIIFFLSNFFCLTGQINYPGKPVPVSDYKLSEIPLLIPDCITAAKRYADDTPVNPLLKNNLDFLHCDINLSYKDIGIWDTLPDGTKVWRVGIWLKNAPSSGLVFSNFNLVPGVRVFLFDNLQQTILGAYTYKNNKSSGIFAVSLIPSNLIYIEMQVLPFVTNPGELELGYATFKPHPVKGTKAVQDSFFRKSGDCNVDINCNNNSDIQTVKNSVVRIIYDGVERCTGTLLNTTRQDGYPLLLTAGHCLNNQRRANNAVFYFYYESPYCDGPDGKASFSISGSTLLATTSTLDFSLVELSETPPYFYHPYYAGWDRRNDPPSNSYIIHHPYGDVKKISVENHPAETGDFTGYTSNTHWRIPHWESGTTEKGSSGGALFNQHHRVTGTLTGGWAECGNSVDDYFQKFYHCWNDYPESSKQLKFWLDPLQTGKDFIEGFDPYRNFWLSGDTISNILDHDLTGLFSNSLDWGYLSGHNSKYVNVYAEKFNTSETINILGVVLNPGVVYTPSVNSTIRLLIWREQLTDEKIVFTEDIPLIDMAADEKYTVILHDPVSISGDFFVGYEVFYRFPQDTFALKMRLDDNLPGANTAYFYFNNSWQEIGSYPGLNLVASLDISLLVYDSVPENPLPDTILPEKEVLIYPNPATDKVSVLFWELPKFDVKINLYNVAGQLIKSELFFSPGIQIDYYFNKIPPGVYFFRMNVNNFIIIKKILILSG